MKNIVFFLFLTVAFVSCKKEGCTNAKALNYDSEAEEDDGSCTIKHEGVYFIKDSTFLSGEFLSINAYEATFEYRSGTDSVAITNIADLNRTVVAAITETTLSIPQQAYDPNADATGTGTFDFGRVEYSLFYGVLEHRCVGTKN